MAIYSKGERFMSEGESLRRCEFRMANPVTGTVLEPDAVGRICAVCGSILGCVMLRVTQTERNVCLHCLEDLMDIAAQVDRIRDDIEQKIIVQAATRELSDFVAVMVPTPR